MVQSLLKKVSRTILVLASFIFPKVACGQGLKIGSLSDLESKAQEGSQAVVNVGNYAIVGVFIVALIFVVYAIGSNNPQGKAYGIGWFVALIIYLIAKGII